MRVDRVCALRIPVGVEAQQPGAVGADASRGMRKWRQCPFLPHLDPSRASHPFTLPDLTIMGQVTEKPLHFPRCASPGSSTFYRSIILAQTQGTDHQRLSLCRAPGIV